MPSDQHPFRLFFWAALRTPLGSRAGLSPPPPELLIGDGDGVFKQGRGPLAGGGSMRQLPDLPNLNQLRHQARELQRANQQPRTLSQAQLALARLYGFPCWA